MERFALCGLRSTRRFVAVVAHCRQITRPQPLRDVERRPQAHHVEIGARVDDEIESRGVSCPAKIRALIDFLVDRFARLDLEREWTASLH